MFLQDRVVETLVGLLEVAKVCAAIGHHLQKSAAGMLILPMLPEVACKLVDAFGEERDLNLRGAGIRVVTLGFLDYVSFLSFREHKCRISRFFHLCKTLERKEGSPRAL